LDCLFAVVLFEQVVGDDVCLFFEAAQDEKYLLLEGFLQVFIFVLL
jgi:hypothetical protein